MAKNFVLSARVTADIAGFKAAMSAGAQGARELGAALDAVDAKARGAANALGKSGEAAKAAPPSAPAPGSPPPPPPPRPGPTPPPAPRPSPPRPAPPAGGLADWQKRNLRSQYFDVASSLYGGMSPLTVLSQQGPQIVEAYGGVGAALRGVAAAFTPVSVAIGGVTAAVVAGAVAWQDYAQTQAAAARSLNGIGRASGLTVGGLTAAAERAAAQAGVSRSQALSGAQTFAAAGVNGDLVPGLMKSASGFARGFGMELSQATDLVAQAMQDPAKGADALSARLGFLDGKTRELIRSLTAQGDQMGAQRVLADRLAASVSQLTTDTTALERAWKGVKGAASDAWSGLGQSVDRIVSGPTLSQQLQAAERALAEARAQTNGNIWWTPADHASALNKAEAEYKRVKSLSDAEAAKAAEAQREQARNRLSLQATDTMRGVLPDAARRQDLADQLQQLEAARGDPQVAAKVGGLGSLADAYERVAHAARTYLDADERQRQSDALSIRSIEARTVAQKAAIAEERTRLAHAGAADVGEAEIARRAAHAAAEVKAQARVDARDRLREARDAASLVGLSDYQRRLRESEQRWREPIANAAGDDKAQADLRAAAAAERAGIAREATLTPMRTAKQGLDEQVAALERQKQAFDASVGAAAEFAAKQQLVNEYTRAGVPITAELRGEIDRYAAAQGRVAQASDDLQRAQQRVVGAMDDIRAQTRNAFGGVLSNLRQGKSVTDGLLNSATGILDRVIEQRVSAPLVEGLLGKDGKAGGGAFGDTVSGWLGGKAVQTANIQAATVIVNGQAVAGGLGAQTGAGATAPANDAASGGGAWSTSARYVAQGVDTRLTDILQTAAARSGLQVAAVSGFRAGDPRAHGKGLATDVQILDPATGRALPNYQDGGAFRQYEQFAQQARAVQMERYPELADQFRWGGYFGGPRGKYGALDTMHFDLAGSSRSGMAGGSWAGGLNDAQRRLWPAAYSAGMPANDIAAAPAQRSIEAFTGSIQRAADASSTLGSGFQDVSRTLTSGAGSLDASASGVAASASQFKSGADGVFGTVLGGIGQVGNSFVGGLGSAFQTILQAISNQGGGGFSGLFSGLFGGSVANAGMGVTGTLLYAAGGVHTAAGPRRLERFAAGGVSRLAAIFGEAGPEAAVPLPDGRTIPVTLRMSGRAAQAGEGGAGMVGALAGAIGRLNDRLSAANAQPTRSGGGPDVVIENRSGASIRRQEESRPGGGRRQRIVIDEAMADAAGRPTSRLGAALDARQRMARR